MAEFAVIQTAMPTGTGTQSYTSTGFGTPKGAIFFGGYGTAAGTAVNDAGFWFGATDGTRSNSRGWASEHNVAASDPGNVRNTTDPIITLLNTSQVQDGVASFSQWVTDGVELNWTDAPPAAYLMTVILIGGSGVSDCYVGTAATPSVVDTSTDVTAPGFQPSFVISTGNMESAGNFNLGVGFATSDNTQRGIINGDGVGANPTATRSLFSDTLLNPNSVVGSGAVEINSFDSSGFSLTLRGTGGTAFNVNYIAVKLNGLNAKLVTSSSPTGNGDHTITGAGFTPQFGMLLHSEAVAVNTAYTTDDGEVFGLSAFTASASASSAISNEDSVTPSDTDSITDTKPVQLLKDGAAFMTATFGAFTNDGVTFNYTASNGTARLRAVLMVQASSGAAANMQLRSGIPYMRLTNRGGR